MKNKRLLIQPSRADLSSQILKLWQFILFTAKPLQKDQTIIHQEFIHPRKGYKGRSRRSDRAHSS
jgi:hypothetical protein